MDDPCTLKCWWELVQLWRGDAARKGLKMYRAEEAGEDSMSLLVGAGSAVYWYSMDMNMDDTCRHLPSLYAIPTADFLRALPWADIVGWRGGPAAVAATLTGQERTQTLACILWVVWTGRRQVVVLQAIAASSYGLGPPRKVLVVEPWMIWH